MVEDTLPQTGDASRPAGWELSQLIQLHVAEYQAVTTRNTYWVTLQYALGPITVGAFVVLVKGRSFVSGSLLSWAAAVFFDLIMLVYYGILYEIYNNTRYLECELSRDAEQLRDDPCDSRVATGRPGNAGSQPPAQTTRNSLGVPFAAPKTNWLPELSTFRSSAPCRLAGKCDNRPAIRLDALRHDGSMKLTRHDSSLLGRRSYHSQGRNCPACHQC
jgi:hypothetical protein